MKRRTFKIVLDDAVKVLISNRIAELQASKEEYILEGHIQKVREINRLLAMNRELLSGEYDEIEDDKDSDYGET